MECIWSRKATSTKSGTKETLCEELRRHVREGREKQLVEFLTLNYDLDPRLVFFKDGKTPLTECAESNNVEIASCLIRRFHCDPDGLDNSEWEQSALHRAAKHSSIHLARFLLNEGAKVDVRAQGSKCLGATPLHWSAARGNEQMVELLLDKGANINAPDAKGATPLRWAIAHSQRKIGEFLTRRGGVAFCPSPQMVFPRKISRSKSSGEDVEEEGEDEEGKREDDVGTTATPTNANTHSVIGPHRERRAESWADLVSSSPLLSPGFAAGGTLGHDVDLDTQDTSTHD